jgi:molecular chaperone GrpE
MSTDKHGTEKSELEKRLEAEAAAEAARARQAGPAESVGAGEAATDEAVEPVSDEKPADMEVVNDPPAELEALVRERDSFREQLLRARAEFDNYRKRTARDIERIRKSAAEGLIADLLPVLDHLDLALKHAGDESGGLAEGVDMVRKQLLETLGRHGLEPIDADGHPFDPHVHEALMQREDTSVPAQTVVEEFQRGYALAGQVLRPAKVVVSTGGPERTGEQSPEAIDVTVRDSE